MDRYIIWDFDGTLAYNQHRWTRTMQKVLSEKYGLNEPVEKINAYFQSGFPWHDWQKSHEQIKSGDEYWELIYGVFRKMYDALNIDLGLHARISSDFRIEYLRRDNWFLFPDTVPTLEQALRGGYRSIILSNNIPELPGIVRALGIEKYFRNIFVSAKIGFEKPNAGAFQIVLKEIEEDGDIWVVGDSYAADVVGARQVRLRSILVRNQHPDAACCAPDLYGIWKFIQG